MLGEYHFFFIFSLLLFILIWEILKELTNNLHIGADKSQWKVLVNLGLLGSCFTATLSSFAAAPRVLMALAEQNIIFCNKFIKKETRGEPLNALIVTSCIVLPITLLADLNIIAQILTMFFLLTYFTVNLILLIEQRLKLISFRPVFKIPKIIPLIGTFRLFLYYYYH